MADRRELTLQESKRYIGIPVDVPEEYDTESVESALEAKPPKRSERISWSEYEDLPEPSEHPDWCGHPDQDAVIEAGRCAAPLQNSVRRFGEIRYCTRLPERRMGNGNWQTASDFCTHHADDLEKQAIPIQEVFDLHTEESLPYDTWL
jgi:hypothetical protein